MRTKLHGPKLNKLQISLNYARMVLTFKVVWCIMGSILESVLRCF